MLDNLINAWGFIGLGIPNFTMALVVMWFAFAYFGWDLAGLFSDEFRNAPWSTGQGRGHDQPLWLPVLIAGLGRGRASSSGRCAPTCSTSCHKPYVTSARAGGLERGHADLGVPGPGRPQPVRQRASASRCPSWSPAPRSSSIVLRCR